MTTFNSVEEIVIRGESDLRRLGVSFNMDLSNHEVDNDRYGLVKKEWNRSKTKIPKALSGQR